MTEPQDQVMAVRQFTRHALAQVAIRLAQSLIEQGLPQGDEALQEALAFALQQAQAMSLPGLGPDDIPADHPLARLAALSSGGSSRLSPHGLWLDLTLLASLSLAHEGFATLCRLLNPQGQPWPTVTLALQWLEHEARVSGDDPPSHPRCH